MAAKTRRLSNWLDTFMQFTEDMPTSDHLRLWTGIFILAVALERKVWMQTGRGRKLFANMQILFVAPPGIGKTILTSTVSDFFEHMPEHKRAADDLSKAAFIDELADAKRSVGIEGIDEEANFNAIMILCEELGALFPTYDPAFMNTLMKLYDGNRHGEKKRHVKTKDPILRPLVNIMAATTPSQLNELMPEGAWDQGFLARTFLIFENQPVVTDLYASTEYDKETEKKLQEDITHIAELIGEIRFSPEAFALANEWHHSGGQPQPLHPRLEHYKTRRTSMHVTKLAMLAAVAESDELVIHPDHFKTARKWLIAMEKRMPLVFKTMHAGGDRQILMDVWFAAYQISQQGGRNEISHSRIFNLVQDRTAESWKVPHLISSLVKQGVLIPQKGSPKDNPNYRVAKKR